MQPRELAASFLKFVKMMITSFFSLDVALLFTNVLLKKTVNIILIKCIYNENQIPTSLSKHSLKKIIRYFQKTALLWTTRWSRYGWVSQHVMTKYRKVLADKLIEDGIIKFYVRYVDDTLLVIKRTDISWALNKFNSFNGNLKFTINAFENCVPYFLDIELCPNGLGIYQTGKYKFWFVYIMIVESILDPLISHQS